MALRDSVLRRAIPVLFGLFALVAPAAATPPLLNPLTQPKFQNPLPIPARLDATAGGLLEIAMKDCGPQWLGLVDPATLQPLWTKVWGYQPAGGPCTYPGPTLVARSDVPVSVLWENQLVDDSGAPLPHLLPVDTSIHWARPAGYPASGVPLVSHLHGGHTESASDGLPDAWFTPGFAQTGTRWIKPVSLYDNDQEAATLWYHDHALGITRLNVYAGLAGFYLLRDATEDWLAANRLIPSGPYEIEMVIQDRMFTADGQLFVPSDPELPEGPEPPSVLPEFFGDFILVNGMTWPVLDVEPRTYRFRLLNGSDSRFYELWIAPGTGGSRSSGPSFQQIGTDGGLLPAPVRLDKLVIGPGERADVVVDFAAYAGSTLVMRNNARAPYPKGDRVDPRTAGQIMAFRVGAQPVEDPVRLPASLRPAPIPAPGPPVRTRELVLLEMEDEYGRLQPMLGTVAEGAREWDDPVTENPMLDDVEIWTLYNATEDAHPIHLHLVTFQILDRQKFRAEVDLETGALSNIRLLGQPRPPEENERGLKDTARMFPGEVTRIIARFDRPGHYVWHCHILSHEDHEMMRPYQVGPLP